MARFETIAIKNHLGERSVIRRSSYDPKKHTLWKGSKAPNEERKESPEGDQHTQGAFEARPTQAKGWWEVINTATQEIQNEKSLRKGEAIALARHLNAKEDV